MKKKNVPNFIQVRHKVTERAPNEYQKGKGFYVIKLFDYVFLTI